MIETLTLSNYDYYLLYYAPICGGIGALVRATILESNLSKYTKEGKTFVESFTYRDFQWYLSHIFIGLVTGLLISLLFIGGLKEEISSLGRVFALAILSGYASPSLWTKQEKVINDIIEKKIEKMIKDN